MISREELSKMLEKFQEVFCLPFNSKSGISSTGRRVSTKEAVPERCKSVFLTKMFPDVWQAELYESDMESDLKSENLISTLFFPVN